MNIIVATMIATRFDQITVVETIDLIDLMIVDLQAAVPLGVLLVVVVALVLTTRATTMIDEVVIVIPLLPPHLPTEEHRHDHQILALQRLPTSLTTMRPPSNHPTPLLPSTTNRRIRHPSNKNE